MSTFTPFGMNTKGLTANDSANYKPNEYLYNGKVIHDEMNLNWLDYGARFYDPVLGRFHAQDVFCEKYLDLNPYQYGANNPILFIDVKSNLLTDMSGTAYQLFLNLPFPKAPSCISIF